MTDVAIPAETSLETSPDPMVAWSDAVGADTNVESHFGQPARAFTVAATPGSYGVLQAVCKNGNQRALPVTAGGFYPIRVRRIVASGSTAYGLIFLG